MVYQALYGERGWWIRPANMWLEKVEHDGQILSRFTYIASDEATARALLNEKWEKNPGWYLAWHEPAGF